MFFTNSLAFLLLPCGARAGSKDADLAVATPAHKSLARVAHTEYLGALVRLDGVQGHRRPRVPDLHGAVVRGGSELRAR